MSLTLRPKGKGGPRGVSEDQMAEALRKNMGIVSMAAAALGISDRAVYFRLANHPELAEIQAQAKNTVTDMAKAKVLKRIERDDWNAINLWLSTQAGWSRRTEVTGADGAPLPAQTVSITVNYVDPKPTGTEEDVI